MHWHSGESVQANGVLHRRIAPTEVYIRERRLVFQYPGAVTGIPIPGTVFYCLLSFPPIPKPFPQPPAAAGPADTVPKFEYQMNPKFEYLG